MTEVMGKKKTSPGQQIPVNHGTYNGLQKRLQLIYCMLLCIKNTRLDSGYRFTEEGNSGFSLEQGPLWLTRASESLTGTD